MTSEPRFKIALICCGGLSFLGRRREQVKKLLERAQDDGCLLYLALLAKDGSSLVVSGEKYTGS